MSVPAKWDEALLRLARTHAHTPAAEEAVRRFSKLGEHAAIWLALGTVGVAVDGSRRRGWRRARRSVAATYVINTAIKFTVRRRRPQLDGLPALTGTPSPLSFPSAHTATSVVSAMAYSRLGVPATPLWVLTGALAYSRLYLGVHYPTDIVGGAALGATIGARVSARLGSGRPR
jgi:undecaprenyl-diphosphatase